MTIQWFGQSFFKISAKNQKGEDVVLAIDPFNKDYGLKVPTKFGADLVLVTHDHKDHNNTELLKGTSLSPEPFVISGAGEYEYKGIMVYGIPAFHDDSQGNDRGDNIIYLINVEDVWITHLGDLGQKTLTNDQLEKIEGTDILMIPIGGTFTINSKDAGKIISQTEPRIVIPMHYNLPGLKFKSNEKLDNVDKFIKELGLKPQNEDRLKIQKKNLPSEETQLVVLNP